MRLFARFNAGFNRTVSFLAFTGAVILVLTMLLVNLEVVMRYFFNSPIYWAEEVSAYGLLYVTFLGAAWVLLDDRHVKIDLLLFKLDPRHQAMVNVFTSILGAIICLVIAWYSARSVWQHFQLGYAIPTLLHPPKGLILAIIPVGSLMLSVQFLRRTYGYLVNWRAPGETKN